MFVRKSLRQVVFTLVTAALLLTACNMGATPAPTVDINAINTAAVETAMGQLSAQFTQTALAAPSATSIPTNTAFSLSTAVQPTGSPIANTLGTPPTVSFNSTPIAGFTQLVSPAAPAGGPTAALGDSCNNNVFVSDVTIPDGTVIDGGADFEKVWAVQNTGTCTWDEGYSLVYIGGSAEDLDPYDLNFTHSRDFVAAGATVNLGLDLTAPCQPGTYQGSWRMRSDSGYFFGTILTVVIEVRDDC